MVGLKSSEVLLLSSCSTTGLNGRLADGEGGTNVICEVRGGSFFPHHQSPLLKKWAFELQGSLDVSFLYEIVYPLLVIYQ